MKYAIWYCLVSAVIELLLEVGFYVVKGKHNWLAIGLAVFFSINAIICEFFYYHNGNKKDIDIIKGKLEIEG